MDSRAHQEGSRTYKLTISAQAKSKARLIGGRKKTNHFIVGREYKIYFVVKNIGNETSSSGRCFFIIHWPGTKASSTGDFHVESLEPNKCYISKTYTLTAHSTGLALISLNKISSKHDAYDELVERNDIRKDGKSKLNFVRDYDKNKLDTDEAFDFIYSTTPEAIYEYWAFIVGAVSLVILAVKEIWLVLRF